MGGSMSRRKGGVYERETVTFMRGVFRCITDQLGKRGERILESIRRGTQTRKGSDEPDVIIPGNWWIECKRGKRTNIKGGFRQAEAAAPDGSDVLVFTRDDHDTTIVSMRADTFHTIFSGYLCQMGNIHGIQSVIPPERPPPHPLIDYHDRKQQTAGD